MSRSSILALAVLVAATGCDDPSGPDVNAEYGIQAALWLWGDETPTIVAVVERLDPNATPATDAVLTANGERLLLDSDQNEAGTASFSLLLPAHAPGDSYVVVAEVDGIQATCTLAAPVPPCTASLTLPEVGGSFTPGDPLVVEWGNGSCSTTEFEVNLYPCVDSGGGPAVTMSAALPTSRVEFPADVTTAMADCERLSVEFIARDRLPVTGELAAADSEGYVVHVNEGRSLNRAAR